jgi:hypothetical protein
VVERFRADDFRFWFTTRVVLARMDEVGTAKVTWGNLLAAERSILFNRRGLKYMSMYVCMCKCVCVRV